MKNYIFNTLIGIFIIILIVVVVSVFVPGNKTALAPVLPDDSSATSTDTNASNTPGMFTSPIIVFGQKTSGDLNKDGKSDSAYIFTQSPGGSGTFFYITAEVASFTSTNASTTKTNSILLGDRIAPQNVSIVNGKIVVNYADRKVGEPMVAKPSVGVTKYFVVQNGLLVEVSANNTATTTVQKPPTSVKPAPMPTKPAPTTAGAKCIAKGGTWSEQYRECGGVDSATCENIGGTFEECASPCRNDPNAIACTMMCVQICKIY